MPLGFKLGGIFYDGLRKEKTQVGHLPAVVFCGIIVVVFNLCIKGVHTMKVLVINASPHGDKGNTAVAIREMGKVFAAADVEMETVNIGSQAVRGCISCYSCAKTGKCVFDDVVNELAPKFEQADGLVVATPVYYASANGTLVSCLDRLFCSTHFDKRMKVGAGIAVARRGGTTATFDVLNKYFTYSGMPVASSQYWNHIHGAAPGEAVQDAEGLQIMRTLAQNMIFLMRSIALGKEKYGLPEAEPVTRTNFVR